MPEVPGGRFILIERYCDLCHARMNTLGSIAVDESTMQITRVVRPSQPTARMDDMCSKCYDRLRAVLDAEAAAIREGCRD